MAPDDGGTPSDVPPDIAVTQARKAQVDLELKRLELRKALRELVPVAEVEPRFAAFSADLRTRMLGTPSHARQYLPERFSPDDVADAIEAFDRAVREQMEKAADAVEGGEL